MMLTPYLLAGMLKGSLATLLVLGIDRLAAKRMQARGRRLWWLLVPLAFLIPVQVTLPAAVTASIPSTLENGVTHVLTPLVARETSLIFNSPSEITLSGVALLWLAGVIVSVLAILLPTFRAHRTWSQARFSTDPALLNLLEDSKALAGVTAPIGLVVSEAIFAPALLGWLRPRLLLPRSMAEGGSLPDLKAVFLHELAHFKALDLPTNWLFALARAVQWFNPFAYLAMAGWAQFREEAADEAAIRWLDESGSQAYGEILLKTLGQCSGGAVPSGALAIGESVNTLKRRMLMIRTYSSKSSRGWLAVVVAATLAAGMALLPAPADEDPATAAKAQAATAMNTWLAGIDGGDYAKSWTDAAASFKKAVTTDQWIAALNSVRVPLGKMLTRKQASSLYQTSIPVGAGKTIQGQYVIAQFNSSFDNLKYAVETVTFEKEADGAWKAAGYYIKPGQ